MIPKVTAVIPHLSLPHGRTRPTIVEAEDGDENRHEVVVKIFRSEERGIKATISELVCELLDGQTGLMLVRSIALDLEFASFSP